MRKTGLISYTRVNDKETHLYITYNANEDELTYLLLHLIVLTLGETYLMHFKYHVSDNQIYLT